MGGNADQIEQRHAHGGRDRLHGRHDLVTHGDQEKGVEDRKGERPSDSLAQTGDRHAL
jgi:hypothetical protein